MRTKLVVLTLFTASAAASAQPAPAPPASVPSASVPSTSTLDVTIIGAIDPALLATSIATELRRPVAPHTAAEGCHAPCLTIAVDAQSATLTFTDAGGATRQRTLPLPADPSQWPTLVTLLAGNLVRDEADELLADVPMPPAASASPGTPGASAPPPFAAPQPQATPQPRAPRAIADERFAPFALTLVPGASTDLFDLQRSHTLSIGLVAESSRRVRGLALSGAVDVAGTVDGAQIAGALDIAGAVSGAQIAGALDVANDVSGAQIAGAATIARTVAGTQIAGALAITDTSRGTQVAGAAAIANGSAGSQIAGALNVARDSAGTQIAGALNIAGTVHGVQIAPFNIARHNAGVQIGVINIGGGPDAEAFGLINIVPGGRTDLDAAIDSDAIGTVMLRHGGRHWHNVYGVGGQRVDTPTGMPNNDVWMLGLGVGPSFHIAGLPADLDAIAWHVNHGSAFDDRLSLLAQARLTIAVPIGSAALIAGGTINTYVSTDRDSPLAIARSSTDSMTSDVRVHIWPSAFIGVRL